MKKLASERAEAAASGVGADPLAAIKEEFPAELRLSFEFPVPGGAERVAIYHAPGDRKDRLVKVTRF
jgi:hypothetical protein